jgi:putative endonuclease
MYCVYILCSPSSGKTYTGFSNNLARRLTEHNISETTGYTLRYRPWVLIYTENVETKNEAMKREKFFKSGQGREEVKRIARKFLNDGMTWSPPVAGKD